MEKLIAPRSLGAVTAIAAVLALGSTPAFAQDAGAQVTAAAPPAAEAQATPPATAVATPEAKPTIVLPPVDAAPEPAAPLEPTVALPAASTPQAPAPTTPRAEAPAPRAERATRATPPGTPRVPTATDAGTAREGTLARGDATPPMAAPAANASAANTSAAAPAPARAPAANAGDDDGFPTEGIIGLVAALGVAGAGIAMMLRRRREPAEEEFVEEPVASEPTPAVMADPMALPSNPPARLGPSAEALAAGPVPIGEDRQAVLDAMVAAEPDEANPFTSRKARLRRARLILQHREHLQMQGKPFDWRTYRPTTRPSNPSPTETLVEA